MPMAATSSELLRACQVFRPMSTQLTIEDLKSRLVTSSSEEATAFHRSQQLPLIGMTGCSYSGCRAPRSAGAWHGPRAGPATHQMPCIAVVIRARPLPRRMVWLTAAQGGRLRRKKTTGRDGPDRHYGSPEAIRPLDGSAPAFMGVQIGKH